MHSWLTDVVQAATCTMLMGKVVLQLPTSRNQEVCNKNCKVCNTVGSRK